MQISNDNSMLKVIGGAFLKGENGVNGQAGPQGPIGKRGPQGERGFQGPQGERGVDGKDGKDGRGIKSLTLVDAKDKIKTYRIEYTDGTSFDFQVKDGEDGAAGKGGMSGGAVLRGAEKTSRKSHKFSDTSKETYPSSYALSSAVARLRKEIRDITIQLRKVDELPEEGEPYILYLVPVESPETSNIYDEYIWAIQEDEEYAWEKLGTTELDLSDYEHKTAVEELDATDSITLEDNTVYNGGEQTSLTIALPAASAASFISEVVFTSGSTATTLSYPNTIKWLGDDLTDGAFVPVASKRYTVIFYYDGVEYVGVVKGIV